LKNNFKPADIQPVYFSVYVVMSFKFSDLKNSINKYIIIVEKNYGETE